MAEAKQNTETFLRRAEEISQLIQLLKTVLAR